MTSIYTLLRFWGSAQCFNRIGELLETEELTNSTKCFKSDSLKGEEKKRNSN